jgi:hypothetical protein
MSHSSTFNTLVATEPTALKMCLCAEIDINDSTKEPNNLSEC